MASTNGYVVVASTSAGEDDDDAMEVVSEPIESDDDGDNDTDNNSDDEQAVDNGAPEVVATVVVDEEDEEDENANDAMSVAESLGAESPPTERSTTPEAELEAVVVPESIGSAGITATTKKKAAKTTPTTTKKKVTATKSKGATSSKSADSSTASSSSSSKKKKVSTSKTPKAPPKQSKKARPSSVKSSTVSKGTSASKSSSSSSSARPEMSMHFARVSKARMELASTSRSALVENVRSLPLKVNPNFVVRSLGQLQIEPNDKALFSSANALYPIGYSCDRHEFCPAHGRMLKMRCSILDGSRIQAANKNIFGDNAPDVPSGPIFRIMWGPGIDFSSDGVTYPYNPFVDSSPIMAIGNVDTVALPATSSSSAKPVKDTLPTVGMRVKTRYEKDQFFYGTVATVQKVSDGSKKRNNGKLAIVVIQYDDGSQEQVAMPDPDITLVMPGIGDETDEDGNVELTSIDGKPVKSVIGATPLEAWSKILIELGLIDEVYCSTAMTALEKSRKNGFLDAKERFEALQLGRGSRRKSLADGNASIVSGENDDEESKDDGDESGSKSIAEKEEDLRDRVAALKNELEEAMAIDRDAADELSRVRQQLASPYLCNPFSDHEGISSHINTWLGVVVRKEKSKMGSTGNRRKVVTATDLLERNDTFFNEEVETMVEGLPGSEYCGSYVFQSARASGAASINRAWLHEAKIKQEKEKERQIKIDKEARAREQLEREREAKRKRRENERDERKRQRMEEEDQKKRARAEERMYKLKIQVDERLFKEACFQREKVVHLLVKSLSREFSRRRKSAELLAGHSASEVKVKPPKIVVPSKLPPLSENYDEDILRIWDLISTFSNFFKQRGYADEAPSLHLLQSMVSALRDDKHAKMSKAEAQAFASNLAVTLCKPLASGVTRMLFASLIALSPALQKDFGATFFNEVDSAPKTKKEGNDVEDEEDDAETKAMQTDMLLPVDSRTWQEIARIALMADALGELGHTRQEQAHLLRGYRSTGHPNSKEARRIRKVEDFPVSVLRQALEDAKRSTEDYARVTGNSVVVQAPSTPSCESTDWIFYLHQLTLPDVSSNANAVASMLNSALEIMGQPIEIEDGGSQSAVEDNGNDATKLSRYRSALKKAVAMLSSFDDYNNGALRDAKALAIEILEDRTQEVYSRKTYGHVVSTDKIVCRDRRNISEDLPGTWSRCRMGQLRDLSLTQKGYKETARIREDYMSNALKFKEEQKRKKLRESGEDIDDDDDDDEEDDDDDDDVVKSNGTHKNQRQSDVQLELDSPAAAQNTEKLNENSTSGPTDSYDNNGDKHDDPVEKGKNDSSSNQQEDRELHMPKAIGKLTPYDDFCGDVPTAPEPIRRCLAVLRAICPTTAAEPFLDPIDPQSNPGYYDTLLKPICLREIGKRLRRAAKACGGMDDDEKNEHVASVVADFGRDIRLIEANCHAYANAGPTVISAGGEMLRIFERLLLDWVLAPAHALVPLDQLDDDLCVDSHPSDADSTVLLCDGCEGNFNVQRLDPPLEDIPQGDWFCPRCVSGRWWGDLDPRIGRTIVPSPNNGLQQTMTIRACHVQRAEHNGHKSSLIYEVSCGRGKKIWPIDLVDEVLAKSGQPVPKIQCVEAVAESQGYGVGIDRGLRTALVPHFLNPSISDTAAQVMLTSSVFRDSINAAGTLLLIHPTEMRASEWIRLLILLAMKCSSSEMMQNVAAEMENTQAEKLGKLLAAMPKSVDVSDVVPPIPHDDIQAPPTVQATLPTKVDDAMDMTDDNADTGSTGKIATTPTPPTSETTDRRTEDGSTMLLDSNAVEVVDSTYYENATKKGQITHVEAETKVSEDDQRRAARAAALKRKARRQKAREDSFAAFCIKNQLRSTVASFEQDTVSQVVESLLGSKIPGLSFAASRCRGLGCHFCGLSDTALGTNLVRVPDQKEWDELMVFASRSRRTNLVADMRGGAERDSASLGKKCIMKVSIRVEGELVCDEKDPELFELIDEGESLQFLPRNSDGFQDEILFRYEHNLPFVSGSLSAHEGCAISAHNARKVKLIQKHQELAAERAEREAGMACARTLEIGRDVLGRSYWRFTADSGSLFVCTESATGGNNSWARYADPESIASVIVALGRDPIVDELRRVFTGASELINEGTWSQLILKKKFDTARLLKFSDSHGNGDDDSHSTDPVDMDVSAEDDGNDEIPFEENDKVLVESPCGDLLWQATVIAVSEPVKGTGKIQYRIRYKGWGSRFEEWVESERVVEPNENNLGVQREMFEEIQTSRKDGFSDMLEQLEASKYLRAKDRSRGSAPLPNFAKVTRVSLDATPDEKELAIVKAALLAVETALPEGAVDNSPEGEWNSKIANEWRVEVACATGPWGLMRCLVLLESVISEEWIKPTVGHVRSCLPNSWKALEEASVSAVALRIRVLDRAILYDTVYRS